MRIANSPDRDEAIEVETSAPDPAARPSYVIMSGYHDYRSKRKANLHFIADELKKRGDVTFFSLRYSYLTRHREDPRQDLWKRANRFERCDGVICYLWRTALHPFRLPVRLTLVERAAFWFYARRFPAAIESVIAKASIVFIESGISITFVPLIRRINPGVQIIYMASDGLDAIRQAGTIKRAFKAVARDIDSARVPSPYLARDIPPEIPCYYIPHGIDKDRFASIGPSPFPPGSVNAVSVGSMLFDPTFFEVAARLFPDVVFHVIGSGHEGRKTANVRYYPEMPFERTLPYLKHSAFAVAAYGAGVEPYLTHTSMKLMQYNYLGVPTVCAEMVAGRGLGRFGYKHGDDKSIKDAVQRALGAGPILRSEYLNWTQVTLRLLSPHSFEDTSITRSGI